MNFRDMTIHFVMQIPHGKVATYGQIAGLVSSPRAARVVGYVLRGLTTDEGNVPWWRVINSKGIISINQSRGGVEKTIQKDLIEDEGITVSEGLKIDLTKYLWEGPS